MRTAHPHFHPLDAAPDRLSASRDHLVYRATSPNGKVYIGMTGCGLHVRRQRHFAAAKMGQGYFARALRKYRGQVKWEVLVTGLTIEQADDLEQRFIAEHKSNLPEFGYNLTAGGASGERSLLTRAKIALSHRGKRFSRAHVESLRLVNAHPILRSDGRPFISRREAALALGVKPSSVDKAVRNGGVCCGFTFISISYVEYCEHLGAWNSIEGAILKQRGWHCSERHRTKLSLIHRGRKQSLKQAQSIRQPVSRSDGKTFPSIQDAARATNLSEDQVAYSMRRGKSYNGFSFTRIGAPKNLGAQKIFRSDGIAFDSMADAARIMNASRTQIRYAVQNQTSLQGFTFHTTPRGL